MKRIAFIPALLIAVAGFSQTDASIVQLTNPPSVAPPRGYSHAAIIDLGNCKMVIMSGQVAFDQQGNLVGKDNLEKQAEQVFLNIRSIVEASGGSMDNIVKLSYFVTDVNQVQSIRNVRDKFVNTKNPPASTLVQVSKLFRDDVMLEVEATAIIPEKKSSKK